MTMCKKAEQLIEQERQRRERLAALLREQGIDPNEVLSGERSHKATDD